MGSSPLPPSLALPRLFISAMTDEFGGLRRQVAEVVRGLGYEPVSMEHWSLASGELGAWHRQQIESCEGLIHIPGVGYGAEPEVHDPAAYGLPAGTPRYSYTQYELLYAQARGLTTWVIQPGPSCTRDMPLDRLDAPKPPLVMTAGEAAAYQLERRRRQRAWNEHLKAANHVRHQPRNDEELRALLHTLRDHAGELRQKFSLWQDSLASTLEELRARVDEGLRLHAGTREEMRAEVRELKRAAKLDRQAGAIKPNSLAKARVAMIDKVRDYWIEGVLEPTLTEAARFNIGHELVPGAVVTEDFLPERELGPQEDIAQLFEDCGRRLLILGSPGSGKTMLLLRLAEPLLRQAAADANAPIPVVLNLSSWWRDRLPLDQWMVREAAVAYRIQPHVMRRWIRDEAVIPLLDGLDEVGLGAAAQERWIAAGGVVAAEAGATTDKTDQGGGARALGAADGKAAAANADAGAVVAAKARDEKALLSARVAAEARAACLGAINAYLEKSPRKVGVAICSRSSEYAELAEKLRLNCALRLQDLTETQVREVLAAEDMQGVSELALAEPWLGGMARNPFLLNLMSVAYRGKHPTRKATQAARQEHLMEAYVDQRLSETRGRREREGGADATAIREQLMWLAHNLTKAGQTVFHLENLQMEWLKKLWARCAYIVSIRLLLVWCGFGMGMLCLVLLGSLLVGDGLFEVSTVKRIRDVLGATLAVGYLGVFLGVAASAEQWNASDHRHGLTWSRRVADTGVFCVVHAVVITFFMIPSMLLLDRMGLDMLSSLDWTSLEMQLLTPMIGAIFSLCCVSLNFVARWGWVDRQPVLSMYVLLGLYLLSSLLVGVTVSFFEIDGLLSLILSLGVVCVPAAVLSKSLTEIIGNGIRTSERLTWNWSRDGAWAGCFFSLLVLLGKASDIGIQAFTTVSSWMIVLAVGVVSGIVFGFRRADPVHMRVGPNEGVVRSLWFSIKLSCGLGFVGFWLLAVLIHRWSDKWPWEMHQITKPAGGDYAPTFSFLWAALFTIGALAGGLDVPVKHYTLRVLLRLSDGVPLRLARSLEEISRVLLLRRVGGGFIFVHRYLLEYFERLARREREREQGR